ncbi:GNAT family N-acetyltransferase [Delftia acidovorans]|uniref:GNAT family N-acetyltransferase n=1 Tax=Delftia acidovorans TaxID=80866 RepID=UPI00286F11A4|nr:GNAT family N-acetyltransferase [Delftia acidovorans]
MHIRPAHIEDAEEISALVSSVSHLFTLDSGSQGAQEFLKALGPQAFHAYLQNPRYLFIVARQGDALAGMAALRDGRHLFHLFVGLPFQRRGLARRLWQALQPAIHPDAGSVTVNSTPFAVPAYERLGFRATSAPLEKNGVAFVPMQIAVAAPVGQPQRSDSPADWIARA